MIDHLDLSKTCRCMQVTFLDQFEGGFRTSIGGAIQKPLYLTILGLSLIENLSQIKCLVRMIADSP